MIKKYRKKPVVIEAMQFSSYEYGLEIIKWITEFTGGYRYAYLREVPKPGCGYDLVFSTYERENWAGMDNWIINNKGEPDYLSDSEFQATYEEVKDGSQ